MARESATELKTSDAVRALDEAAVWEKASVWALGSAQMSF
jgi:hypothetical protein